MFVKLLLEFVEKVPSFVPDPSRELPGEVFGVTAGTSRAIAGKEVKKREKPPAPQTQAIAFPKVVWTIQTKIMKKRDFFNFD